MFDNFLDELNPEYGGNGKFIQELEDFDEYSNTYTFNNRNDYFNDQMNEFNKINDDRFGEENVENQVVINEHRVYKKEKMKSLTEINSHDKTNL